MVSDRAMLVLQRRVFWSGCAGSNPGVITKYSTWTISRNPKHSQLISQTSSSSQSNIFTVKRQSLNCSQFLKSTTKLVLCSQIIEYHTYVWYSCLSTTSIISIHKKRVDWAFQAYQDSSFLLHLDNIQSSQNMKTLTHQSHIMNHQIKSWIGHIA